MHFENTPGKPETFLSIGQIVRIPERLLRNEPGYPVQTADNWRITDIHTNHLNEPVVLVEKPSISKNIPLKEMEELNPKV